jgi:hypothetical protein
VIQVLDDKLARIKKLIAKREQIDAELSVLLGITEKTRRGRQSKEDESHAGADTEAVENSASRPA